MDKDSSRRSAAEEPLSSASSHGPSTPAKPLLVLEVEHEEDGRFLPLSCSAVAASFPDCVVRTLSMGGWCPWWCCRIGSLSVEDGMSQQELQGRVVSFADSHNVKDVEIRRALLDRVLHVHKAWGIPLFFCGWIVVVCFEKCTTTPVCVHLRPRTAAVIVPLSQIPSHARTHTHTHTHAAVF